MSAFPDTIETQITERIMSRILQESYGIKIELTTQQYNRVFSSIHKELTDFGLNEKLRADRNPIEEYKKQMIEKYKPQTDTIHKFFPKGVFTLGEDNELVGIDISLSKIIREMLEVKQLNNPSL